MDNLMKQIEAYTKKYTLSEITALQLEESRNKKIISYIKSKYKSMTEDVYITYNGINIKTSVPRSYKSADSNLNGQLNLYCGTIQNAINGETIPNPVYTWYKSSLEQAYSIVSRTPLPKNLRLAIRVKSDG